ncbi:MAG: hypothetical protein KatS3mg115_1796 [Candidatus Poribacteria bacterium]|nr:MAG: hypothetical protein KatS3mg115_1796 [Candidatus Poribacteria bacterium]
MIRRLECGAYLLDALQEETPGRWERLSSDSSLRVSFGPQGLQIHGRTERSGQRRWGVLSCRPYPPDAVLCIDVSVPSAFQGRGNYAVSVRLCGGTPAGLAPKSAGTGADISFGRYAGREGWFHGWSSRSQDFVVRSVDHELGLPALGWENVQFVPVRIAYSDAKRLLDTAVWDGSRWQAVGETHRYLRSLVHVALQVETESAGLEVDARFRRLRLYPNPEHYPVRLLTHGGAESVSVRLSELEAPDRVIAEGQPDGARGLLLWLPPDALYPLGGRLQLLHRGQVLAEHLVRPEGLSGIYPGDVYSTVWEVFYI